MVNILGLCFDNDDAAAALVKDGVLVAAAAEERWMRGRSEWGPRALGARSILADPRRKATSALETQSGPRASQSGSNPTSSAGPRST